MSSIVAPSNFPPFLPSPTHATAAPARQRLPALDKLQDHLLARPLYRGLRTPPTESNMNATYQNPVLSNTYNSHVALARQPTGMAQTGRVGGGFCDASNPSPYPVAHPPRRPQYQQPQPAQAIISQQPHPSSRPSTRSTTPNSCGSLSGSLSVHSEGTISKKDSTMVTHSLRLPPCISPNGGNLDDFAALMTCFFWFETMDTIQAAEHIKERPLSGPIPPLSHFTQPCAAYKQWVNKVLSTTQVTQNVIMLALLFVYRLKKVNPKVNGSPGSEYRLLTVALMLGNKFLDDNTYTNLTWAEVSSIPVKEIHTMEVEFLSNMRYGLLTSKEEWEDWLKKLACFHQYCESAAMDARRRNVPPMPMNISPTNGRYTSPLPSPTNILPSTGHGSSSLTAAYSPNMTLSTWNGYHATPSVSPLAVKPSLGHPMVRKRSLEEGDMVEPAPKRAPRQPPMATRMLSNRPIHGGPDPGRLSVPHLTLDTSQSMQTIPPPVYPSTTYPPQQAVSLPPLGSGMRAMSTVYPTPTPTTTWTHQGPIMAPCGPQTPSYPAMPPNYGTPTKRQSPTSLTPYGSSPLAEVYGTHTPISNSPLAYLQQRASPYKPVRAVNTLLNPAPSLPLNQYHLGSSQMHYQPLGRPNDLRSGIVPEFLPAYVSQRPSSHPPNHPY
ncbi:hypothetical protein GGR53DRAFT_167358 [Hypoxylon sp. FL1150]|nr:hypothetical protein GGR53DRAFT_167358 [Hypoxylon sp. FL1150]